MAENNKKRYVFTDEDKQDIISNYRSGLSCAKIAERYPCSAKTIERLLRKNNISRTDNPNNITLYDLPQEDKDFIVQKYINGMTTIELSSTYNCSESAISSFLNKNGVAYKDSKHCHYINFSEEEIANIIEKYKSGYSITDLTKEHNCNYQTINKVIPIDIKQKYKANTIKSNLRKYNSITSDEKEDIRNKYLQGIFQKELSIEYNCSQYSIKKILDEYGVTSDDNPKWNRQDKSFDDKVKLEIVSLYKKGTFQEELANYFDCSREYIRKVLYEYGCTYEDNPKYSHGITEELIPFTNEIIQKYNSGESINKIRQHYNASSSVITNILKSNNINIEYNPTYYSEEELLNFLIEIYSKYQYVNTELLNSLERYPTSATYANRFGSFKNAMGKAKLPYSTSIHLLDDEICRSGFEYRLSLMLKKYQIEYERDYPYSNIIPNFNKKHTIDYKIHYKNNVLYLEIFGMTGNTLSTVYDDTKDAKLKLCRDNNVKLISLYPADFKFNNEKFEKQILQLLEKQVI